MTTHSGAKEDSAMTSNKVRAALELRQKMKEHRRLLKVMEFDYRELDIQYEELIGNFNDEEQSEMYQNLMKEVK
jgi:hypothetical protein